MKAFDKSLLSWNEIDHSIISAIGALQIARNCVDSANGSASCKLRPLSPSYQPIQPGLDERSIRHEQVAFCFDEAERMLDEVRARVMIARAILLGGPTVPAAACREEPMQPAQNFESRRASAKGFALQRSLNPIDFAERIKRSIAIIGRIAALRLEWLRRLRNSISQIRFAAGRSLKKRIKLGLRRSSRASAAHARSIMKFGKLLLSSAAAKASQVALVGFSGKPFHVHQSSVAIGAVLSLVAACALSAWTVTAAMVGPSATVVPRIHMTEAAPGALPAYSGCAVSGWGKACYPRRAHQP